MNFSPDVYKRALCFAAAAHDGQLVPGSKLPYLTHLVGVAAELLAVAHTESFDVELAVVCALLHDTLEDTKTDFVALEDEFGPRVCSGVSALTKNSGFPKDQQMRDSLARIAVEPPEVAMVKLADRISNLEPPPHYWTREKCLAYQEEARYILATIGHASPSLAKRLAEKIEAYTSYIPKSS